MFIQEVKPLLDSIMANSYGMILLHYVGDFNSVRIYMKSCIKMAY